jgi:hypothetical protein
MHSHQHHFRSALSTVEPMYSRNALELHTLRPFKYATCKRRASFNSAIMESSYQYPRIFDQKES